MKLVLIPGYFPPVSYFSFLIRSDDVLWDVRGHYEKQSYRNRLNMLTPNGILTLSIPIQKHRSSTRTTLDEVQIFNAESWQRLHFRSLETAYRSAPFFEYYEAELSLLFERKYDRLMDFLKATFSWVCSVLNLSFELRFTREYLREYPLDHVDRRQEFDPKCRRTLGFMKYPQVFSDRFDFMPDLSILDLLFCEGPRSRDYLDRLKLEV